MLNEVFDDIYNKYKVNKLAHAFLFETNNISKCYDDLILLIKKLNCEGDDINECAVCKLIDKGSLPSLVVVEPEGLLIKKSQILDLKTRFVGIPLYSRFNNYIIKYCDKLNGSSANSMLKFLEEPIDNVLGFFITENKENVITTVKSRCQIYSVLYDTDNLGSENEFYSFIDRFIVEDYDVSYMLRKEFLELFSDRSILEKNFSLLLEDVMSTISANKDINFKIFNLINEQNMVIIVSTLKKVLQMLRSNVNIDLVLDTLIFEMGGLNG